MSRMIKVDRSKERFTELIKSFAEWLAKAKLTNGKIQYQQDIGKIDRKATVTFTGAAWLKAQYLVQTFSTEVGWHMVCRRSEEDEDEYIIEDILIYPQEVASATVNTDQKAYEDWLNSLPDEVFNNLRGHGHSHVNMGVTPSATDVEHQDGILEQLGSDMFYIFTIWNKKGDKNWRIFDYKKNILFETADVEVLVENDDNIFDFLEDTKEKVKERKYTSTYWGSKTATAQTTQPKTVQSSAPTVTQIASAISPTPQSTKKSQESHSSAEPSPWTTHAWDYDYGYDY